MRHVAQELLHIRCIRVCWVWDTLSETREHVEHESPEAREHVGQDAHETREHVGHEARKVEGTKGTRSRGVPNLAHSMQATHNQWQLVHLFYCFML